MKNFNRLMALILSVTVALGIISGISKPVEAATALSMYYDDRKPVTELQGSGQVSITNEKVTSYKVGTSIKDDHVLTNVDGKIIAVGTGTATLKIGTTEYSVTVNPAPITMILVAGHSLSVGQGGVASQSVLCDAGWAYSTRVGSANSPLTISANQGLGYGSANRPQNIDALAPGGGGVYGNDSAVAYHWKQLTGEKIWVINAGVGGSGSSWWKSGSWAYENCKSLFQTAETIMKNEIAANHYILKHMGVIFHNAENEDYDSTTASTSNGLNTTWTLFKDAFKMDFGSTVGVKTVDVIGVIPAWRYGKTRFSFEQTEFPQEFKAGKLVDYSLGYFGKNDIILASTSSYYFLREDQTSAFFANKPVSSYYPLMQNGGVPTNPTSAKSISQDGVHQYQVGYNISGYEGIESLYNYWYGKTTASSVKLVLIDGTTEINGTTASPYVLKQGEKINAIPITQYGVKLTATVSNTNVIKFNDLSMKNATSVNYDTEEFCVVEAVGSGTATLTISSNGKTLKTVVFQVGGTVSHVCSSPVYVSGKAATCLATGLKPYYKCGSCSNVYEDQTLTKLISNIDTWKIIPKLDHTWNISSATADTDKKCTVCGTIGEYKTGGSSAHVHNYTYWISDALKHCQQCSCGAASNFAAHTWNVAAATTQTDKHCTVCGYVSEQKLPSTHTHKGTLVSVKSATCTADGTKSYYTCTCGKYFEDQACTKEITNINTWKVIAATGHSYSTTWTKNSTNHWHVCTKCGATKDNVAHTWNYSAATEDHDKHCTVCGYVAQSALQHTHKGTFVSGTGATCTVSGTKSYYSCSCGKYFEDSTCTKEITNINTWKVIAATGHKPGAEATCQTAQICLQCGTEITAKKEHSYSAEFYFNGQKHWHVCVWCGKFNDIADHTWNAPAATDKNDKHCTVCGYVAENMLNHTHKGTYHSEVPATCGTAGTKAYYECSCGVKFSDSACKTQITNIVIPAKGHDYYNSWSISSTNHWHECKNCKAKKDNVTHTWNYSAATEEHDKSCTVCGYIAQKKLQHTHKGTLVNGKSATCTVDGTKSYYTCTCGKYFEDSSCTKEITDINTWKVIKATGHVPGAAATATTAQICTVCKVELAPALGGGNNTSGGNTGNGGSTTTNPTPVVTPSPVVTPVVTPVPTQKPSTPVATPTPVVTPVPETGLAGFIERLYNVALSRNSEPAGKEYWINEVKFNNQTGSDVANGFLVSDEFLSKQMSNSDFLEVLYKTFFDRTSDAQGKAYWLDLMNNGYSKKDVINGFCNSTEWANLCLTYGIPSGSSAKPTIVIEPNEGTKAFVTRLYETCLGRAPEQGGFEYWTYRLANLEDRGYSAAEGFFFSDEFVSKKLDNSTFVTLLYRTILGREPDQAGLNYWLGLMNNGMSKKDVLKGFASSNEWADICSNYGILK